MKVLIAGCGNIGYRHLQAVCALPEVAHVLVVEPDRYRRQRVLTGDLQPDTTARLHGFAALDEVAEERVDAVISAVTADLQPRLIEALAGLRFDIAILEKPVAQSAAELARARRVLAAEAPGAAVYVNCVRELFAGFAWLRRELHRPEVAPPLEFAVGGNSWGYGCNGIHLLDLFRFLTGCREIVAVAVQLAPAPGGNKRGPRFEEFVGTASFQTPRGDTLELTCGGGSLAPSGTHVLIRERESQRMLFLVDEGHDTIHDLAAGRTRPLETLYVSQATGLFLGGSAALAAAGRVLPTLDQAAVSHAALFQSLELATGRRRFRIT